MKENIQRKIKICLYFMTFSEEDY